MNSSYLLNSARSELFGVGAKITSPTVPYNILSRYDAGIKNKNLYYNIKSFKLCCDCCNMFYCWKRIV